MASLLKPTECNKCQCKNVHKEKSPERWVCDECDNIICSRSKRITNSETCLKCGKHRNNIAFRKGKNICVECHSKYNSEYRNKNKERIKEKTQEYWEIKGKELGVTAQKAKWLSVRKTIQKTSDNFLVSLASRCRKQSNKKKVSKNGGAHTNSPIDVCDIDSDYLKELFDKQNGKCAITGLDMVHKYSQLDSISVDRIDSSRGYLKDNVQLICQSINRMKNTHTQKEVLEFLERIMNV